MKEKVTLKNIDSEIEINEFSTFVVSRQTDGKIQEEIRIRLNKDGTININSNHENKILPQATNSIFINFSK